MSQINSFQDLDVYKEAFALQQRIYELSKNWSADERFSLTNQIRRSSRSIGANLAEAWAKRRYPAHFVSKLTDADGERQETDHWICTVEACQCEPLAVTAELRDSITSIGKRLGRMIEKHDSFCLCVREPADLSYPTSDLRPPTSDLRPPTSDLRPPTSDL
jgi:four helix bundle protein